MNQIQILLLVIAVWFVFVWSMKLIGVIRGLNKDHERKLKATGNTLIATKGKGKL